MNLKRTGLPKEVILSIKEIVNKNPNYKFYIFGSRAKGRFKNTSDIDIAVFKDATDEDKFKIMNEFDMLNIIYKIDLVFINKNIKAELFESINKNKIKL